MYHHCLYWYFHPCHALDELVIKEPKRNESQWTVWRVWFAYEQTTADYVLGCVKSLSTSLFLTLSKKGLLILLSQLSLLYTWKWGFKPQNIVNVVASIKLIFQYLFIDYVRNNQHAVNFITYILLQLYKYSRNSVYSFSNLKFS